MFVVFMQSTFGHGIVFDSAFTENLDYYSGYLPYGVNRYLEPGGHA